MKKKILITGISGQDGSYLAEYLLKKNYRIFGIIRRNSDHLKQTTKLKKIENQLDLTYGDLNDISSINNLVFKIKPDEIYNLAAQSHVGISFKIPQFTLNTNGNGFLNLMEAVRNYSPKSRIYQASSSEMFGISVNKNGFQNEETKMEPNSVYGCAKVLAYNLSRYYRRAYKIFVSNGILFNHESPRRGTNFVTNKIIKEAIEIKLGFKNKIKLGNLNASRDWGDARDYVKAMHKILKYKKPEDFVIASGNTKRINEFCEIVFKKLNLNFKDHLIIDENLKRPSEVPYLKGDSTKARRLLKWKPEFTLDKTIDDMLSFWKEEFKKNGYY